MQAKARTCLRVTVIGGGIGGLATSILLAQSGHHVTVLEHKDASIETRSTGGIAIFNNGFHVIKSMGLGDEILQISDSADVATNLSYTNGKVVKILQKSFSQSMVHRADVLKTLYSQAVKLRVDVRFEQSVISIQDSSDQPVLLLKDGTKIKSDLVVGADGIESLVRRAIFPQSSARLSDCTVMLLNVPQSKMQRVAGTSELWDLKPYTHIVGPERSIICWAMTKRQVYHLQMCDYDYSHGERYNLNDHPDAPYITTMHDLSGLKKRWSDFEPRVQYIMDSVDSYTKWRIAEVPPLPSFHSRSGRIVLLGDAAHAVQPFAGQGANMALEDAAALNAVLLQIASKEEIYGALRAYDEVRVPRLARLRAIIENNVESFNTLKDTDQLDPKVGVDVNAMVQKRYLHRENFQWLEEYEADVEARKVWEQLKDGRNRL